MKKSLIILLTAVFIGTPLFSFAQTTDAALQLQALLQQIQALQNQLNALQQQAGPAPLPPPAVIPSRPVELPQNIPSFPVFNRDLYLGIRNSDEVRDLQEFLTEQGYYAGPISGNYFFLTASAVKKFQSANGINPTGYLGPKARAVINEMVRKLVSQICVYEEDCRGGVLPAEQLKIIANSDLTGSVGGYFEAAFNISGGSGKYKINAEDVKGEETAKGLDAAEPGKFCERCRNPRQVLPNEFVIFGIPERVGVISFTLVVKDDSAPQNYGKERFTIVIKDNRASNRPPVISGVKGPTTLKVGEEGTWTINAYDPQNGNLNYRVIWGDEIYAPGIAQEFAPRAVPFRQTATFSHIYYQPGIYNPVFYVVNDRGFDVKTSISVNVTGEKPIIRKGSLYIAPDVMNIKIGEKIRAQAFYQAPAPECPAGQYCALVMPLAPYPVAAKWSNPDIVNVFPAEDRFAVTVVGVSAGSGEIKAVYEDLAATAKIIVNSEVLPVVVEQVKCVFNGATTEQKCYTAADAGSPYYGAGCSGFGSCLSDIKGNRGDKVTWKSSCGGYAYTVLDGQNENAQFQCGAVIQPSIQVLSPNGGENFIIGSQMSIYWTTQNLAGKAVVIDLWKGGFSLRNIASYYYIGQDSSKYYTSWAIPYDIPVGSDYTIRVSGYAGLSASDTSDAPFSIGTGGVATSSPPDLQITKVTKADFHPYGFNLTVCMAGPRSINDLKLTNPGVTSFPVDYVVYDSFGGKYRGDIGVSGYPEQIKDGQCATYGGTIQQSEQPYYNQTKRADFVVDPKNIIQESNESNNIFSFSAATTTPASAITLISPNGGEKLTKGSAINIQWKWSGDINSIYIKLRKGNDTYYGPEGAVAGNISNTGFYQWAIPTTLPDGSDYYIRVIDAAGRALDDSDFPFGIASSQVIPTSSDLRITSATKGDFHPYGFMINVCVDGPKSINDIKIENSAVASFPAAYYVYDTGGGKHRGNASASGGVEAIKNGQCLNYGLTIQSSEQYYYDQTRKVEFVVDPDNLIKEINENNNSVLFTGATAPAPTITMISPNGGEKWVTGQTYPVSWSALNLPSGTTINLQLSYQPTTGGTFEDVIVSGLSNTGVYQWTILSKYGTGMNSNAFKMRVYLVGPNIPGTSGPQDYSDSPFSITAAAAPYPGFFMKTDKPSYSLSDTVLLTLSRADNRTDPYAVDLYAMKTDGSNKVVISPGLQVGQNTIEKIQLNSWPIFSQSGDYLLATCPAGCVYGSDGKTNSTFFTLTSGGTTATATDLRVSSVTKGNFHPYGFNVTVCVDGPKSIDDWQLTNPSIIGFPVAYIVYDSAGGKHQGDIGVGGYPEQIKNGQCSTYGGTIQQPEQPYYDQTKKVDFAADPNNMIQETDESNNIFSFIGPAGALAPAESGLASTLSSLEAALKQMMDLIGQLR